MSCSENFKKEKELSAAISNRDYGVFVVTKEVYEKVKVGDEVRL